METIYPEAYVQYLGRQKELDRFVQLAELSIQFTAFTLAKIPEGDLKAIKIPRPDWKKGSMIPRAAQTKEVHVQRGWVTYEEYAKEAGLSRDQVEERAREGKLGPTAVIPETGAAVLFWPPQEHAKTLGELPLPSKTKTYSVTLTNEALVSIEGDWEEGASARNTFLKLASSQGDPKESSEHALSLLRRVSFIEEWSSFEVYLREIVAFLLRKHPKKITASGKGKKASVGIEDVIAMSNGFQSIEQLRERIVEQEIARRQEDGQLVHGLINFLKDEFRFERDPYREPYIMRGKREVTHYKDIEEIKEVRNALMHDGGVVPASFFASWPRVPHDSAQIQITYDYSLMALLTLRSVGLGIAASIAENQYTTE